MLLFSICIPTYGQTIVVSHNNSHVMQVNAGLSICPTSETTYYREYDLDTDFNIDTDFDITHVQFFVEFNSVPVNAVINIYSLPSSENFPESIGVLLASKSITIPFEAFEHYSVPITATIPAGENLICEITIDNTSNSIISLGGNLQGQTDPTWWVRGVDCDGTNEITEYPVDNALILTIIQENEEPNCTPEILSNDFENGFSISGNQRIANDINIPIDHTLSLETLSVSIVNEFDGVDMFDILIHSDNNGIPSNSIVAQLLNTTPISETLIGAAGTDQTLNVYEYELDLSLENILLEGGQNGTKYWIELVAHANTPGSIVFWEATSALPHYGSRMAIRSSSDWVVSSTFLNNGPLVNGVGNYEGVFSVSGTCQPTLNVDDNILSSNLKFGPNPITDTFQIENAVSIIEKVTFYNLLGQKVKEIRSNTNNLTLSLNDLNSGIYLVKVENSDNTSSIIKVIKD